MDPNKIDNIIAYLKTSKLSENVNDKEKKYILANAYKFTLFNDQLYYLQPFDMHCFKKVLNYEQAKEVFIQYHHHPLGGHLAFANTFNRIHRKYFWDNMNKDICSYIQECTRCQEHGNKSLNEKAYPVPVPVTPFAQVGIDIKHVTSSQAGYRYIIVAIDYLTKYIEVRAIRNQTSSEIASFIYEEIITRHNTPRVIITDNGKPFVSELFENVCNTFGIRHKTISPYHSQASGLVERVNRTIDAILKKRNANEKNNWPDYLPATAFAYRSLKQATTKQSPFYLLYGYEPTTYFDNSIQPLDVNEPSFELQLLIRTSIQIHHLEKIRNESLLRIKKSQVIQQKRVEDRMMKTKKELKPGFKLGDVVKVYRDNISTSWSGKIMIRWYEDNFVIHEKLKKGSYFIKNISNTEDTRIRLVHGNRLKAFTEPRVNWEQKTNLISIATKVHN